MKVLAAFLLGAMVSGPVFAQDQPMPDSSVVASRQDEIARLGRSIYRVNFNDGSWTHEEDAVCPAFRDYAFARYDQKRPSGETASFLAIIPLTPGLALEKSKFWLPSKSRPWADGIILQPISRARKETPSAEQSGTYNLFNRLWTEQIRRSGNGVIPNLTWGDLANCYARFAGESPMLVNTPDQTSRATPTIDLRGPSITSILVELQSSGPTVRSLWMRFDDRGLIDKTRITASARVN